MPHSLYDLAPLEPLIASGCQLLTPNYRLARRIKSEWDARRSASGDRVWEPLAVQPLESWLMAQWERALAQGLVAPLAPLSQGQAVELWQQVIAEEEQLSGQYHLLRPAGAADLARQAYDILLRWQVDPGEEHNRQAFTLDADCGTYLRWHALFESRLAAAGQCTPLACYRQLLTIADKLQSPQAALLDFDDVPPLYRSLVNALCQQVHEIQPRGEPGECRTYAFTDKRAELEAIARWAKELNAAQPETTIGVVLSDMDGDRVALEYLMRREFASLGDSYNSLPVNFSTGISLDRAPVVRDALGVLALGNQHVKVPALVTLLHSRFLKMPDADSALANRLIRRLYDAGREELEVAELRYSASQVKVGDDQGLLLGNYLVEMSGMRELRRAAEPSAWVQRFCDVLDIWGWPGNGPLDSLEYQQVELWYRTLEDFSAYDTVLGPLDYESALQLLRRCASRQVSQPKTADSNVQVLGPLEAAGLAFDQLWLSGMQGSSWPAPARPNPFIPQALQRRLQMPHATAEREWAFAEGLFQQYRLSARHLHASYTQQVDGVPELPSALLQAFPRLEPPLPGLPHEPWLTQWQQRKVVQLSDWQAPAMTDVELSGASGGSGLLEDQSQCPFRAYARRRLGVEPLAEFSVALSAAERGSILHDALYALWRDIDNQANLLALDSAAQAAIVASAALVAIEAVPVARRRSLGEAYWRLEARRLESLLEEWLTIERQRSEFAVQQLEEDISLTLGRLQIQLRVDRVDQLPDGSRVIIDYKSGVSKSQDWLGARPARPQLLLYGIAAPESAAALAFAQLRTRDCRFVGLGRTEAAPGIQTDIAKVVKDSMDASDWESLTQRWQENLQRLASEFVEGAAQVDPLSPASCTWCGLQSLCRIGQNKESAT